MEQNKIFLTKNEIFDKKNILLIKYNTSDKKYILPINIIQYIFPL